MGNLIIYNNNTTKTYECQTTHTTPNYLVVNSSYLNLTTATTTGLQMKIKQSNEIYRPMQTYTSTSSKSSQYTSTSGYTGKRTTSKQITKTTGYSGRSSRSSQYISTSAYGITSYTRTLRTVSSVATTAYYKASYTYSSKVVTSKSGTSSKTKVISCSYQLYGYRNSTSTVEVTNAPKGTATLGNLTDIITTTGFTLNISSTQAYVNCYYTCSINFDKQTAIMHLSRAYPTSNLLSKLASEFKLTYNNQGSALTKTVSRTSAYTTSSTAVGAMSSTTALTRTSSSSTITNASSTTTNTVLLSTTALTKTASRSSQYNITTEI